MSANAQTVHAGSTERPLFDDDATLAVSIEGPLSTIMRNRDETEEFPATRRYRKSNGAEVALDVKLRVRGKLRLKRDTCNFAPLRVNFKKQQVKETIFAGQNTIKLVTDCQSSKSHYQQLLLKEYLAYKIINLLSDRSFSARLLHVEYVNRDRNNKARQSYAFFFEDEDHIADRLGLRQIKIPRTQHDDLNGAQTNLVNVYQYLIANTDFSLIAGPTGSDCCHNAVLYQEDGGPYIPIPYDFDSAGLVNAPYASPDPRFKTQSVRQRVYRGRCINNSHLDSTLKNFLAKRDEIYQLVTGLDGFNEKSIKTTIKLIDKFYRDISMPKLVQRKLIERCS